MLRLQKKHQGIQAHKGPIPDATVIIKQQSVWRALAAGIAVVLVFGWLWALLSVQTGRIFPWFTILIGAFVGVAVQRYGRGLDWRFPVIAALLAWSGAYLDNLMIGIAETGRYIEAAPARVAIGLSKDTMENFFANTVTPVDHIYALCAAGVAAFFAKRRLNRREVLALRTMSEDSQ
ncbi:MAG: hypothetical protein R3192_00665 [Woeseiaceae bacterium]|nr:hypothetical protein [Woeseiaceae bacterium]